MSTRQNKKRKGRNNLNNRERTVTTLTEDPNTPYLVPTPSEEPAGVNLMSSPFSVASSSGPNQPNIQVPASGFPSFGFTYNNFMPPMHPSVHPSVHPQQAQQFFHPPAQPALPPGQNDLEILENLKKMIKDGQHELYLPIPQPAALASLYLGPPLPFQVPPHPEQVPDHQTSGYPQASHDKTSDPFAGNNGQTVLSSFSDSTRRPPQIHTKENWDAPRKSVPSVSSSQISNNVLLAPSPDLLLPVADSLQFSQSNQTSPTQPPGSRYNSGNSKASNSNVPPTSGLRSDSDSRRQSLDTKPPSASAGSDVPSPSRRFRFEPGASTDSPKPLAVQVPGDQNHDQQRSASDKLGTGESAHGLTASPEEMSATKSPFDGKKPTSPRDPGPVSPDDQRPRLDPERPNTRPSNPEASSSAGDAAIRPPGPRDLRYNDREGDRSRESDRDQERDRNWDIRGRDPYRRFDYRFRDDRPRTDFRRPPPYQRHYEPRYSDMPPPRRYDSKPSDEVPPVDQHPDIARSVPSDDRGGRVPTLEDRPVHRPADDRSPPRALLPDNHPSHVAPVDDRRTRPATSDGRRPSVDGRVNRPATAQIPADEGAHRSGNTEVRTPRLPPQPLATEDRAAQPKVPLEDRINRPPPSLQARLSQPPQSAARPENSHLIRQPSLEERLSYASIAVTDHSSRPAQLDDRLARTTQPPAGGPERARPVPPSDERSRPVVDAARPTPSQDARTTHPEERSGRPAPSDRYVRPITPVQDRAPPRSGGYDPPLHRSTSVTREEPRAPARKTPPPSPVRSFRAAGVVDPPRGRPELRNGYRPESDRYADDRRSDMMDVDGSPRFTDNRVPYNRRFSPPSAADLARDRARAFYPPPPPSPPRAATDVPPYGVDVDRRYPPPGDRRDWGGGYSQQSQQPPYGDRRREWNLPEDDLYWKSQPQRRTWDRNSPPDKERFERIAPPPPPPPGRNHGWETREERERRTSYPVGSPSARQSFDGQHSRPLSSRLTDGYPRPPPGAADDRAYPLLPQRELERSRYSPGPGRDNSPPPPPPPPFSRVRRRSPTPIGTRLQRLAGFTDDMRPPPMKRSREDSSYPPGYYSPPPPRDPTRRSSILSSDYPPPRSVTPPPPPSSGSSYYDSRSVGPPPPMSGSSGGGGGPREREYMGPPKEGLDYGPGPASYDRRSPPPSSRLPPPSYGRNVYGRGGDRDDRRYDMQPPPPPPPPRTA